MKIPSMPSIGFMLIGPQSVKSPQIYGNWPSMMFTGSKSIETKTNCSPGYSGSFSPLCGDTVTYSILSNLSCRNLWASANFSTIYNFNSINHQSYYRGEALNIPTTFGSCKFPLGFFKVTLPAWLKNISLLAYEKC